MRDGQYACDANNDDSICGYYFELQKPAGGQPLGLARQVTRDMSRFRDSTKGLIMVPGSVPVAGGGMRA